MESLTFSTSTELANWLSANHAVETELWIRVFKKNSGTPSVSWDDCVIAALTFGWIDGQRKALDDVSFLQRITPRRPKSNWSQKNCEHAERLIAEGLMQPAGLAQVESARQDGRWNTAYAGSAKMVIPEDFLAELAKNPAATTFYETLNRKNLFSIYHRVETAKSAEARANRIAKIIAQLARAEPFQ